MTRNETALAANHSLVGIAVDLSASMKQSLRNDTGGELNRFESFWHSLKRLLNEGAKLAKQAPASDGQNLVDLFVYGFGLRDTAVCDLLALVQEGDSIKREADYLSFEEVYGELKEIAKGEGLGLLLKLFPKSVIQENKNAAWKLAKRLRADEAARKEMAQLIWDRKKAEAFIKRLVAMPVGEVTLPIEEVAQLLAQGGELGMVGAFIYGETTPMKKALSIIQRRFEWELRGRPPDTAVTLFILSDGQSTDGDPLPVIEQIKALGVTVVSCFVTDEDIANPRTLYNRYPRRGLKQIDKGTRDFIKQLFMTADNYWNLGRFFLLALLILPLLPIIILLVLPMLLAIFASEKLGGILLRNLGCLLSLALIVAYSFFAINFTIHTLFPFFTANFSRTWPLFVLIPLLAFVLIFFATSWQLNWPGQGKRIMFDLASTIPREDSPFIKFLRKKGWKIKPKAKLFVQVNHSQVMEEFIRVIRM